MQVQHGTTKCQTFVFFAFIILWWIDPSWQPPLSHLLMPPQQDGGGSRKGKSEKKLMGRDKDRLTCEEKLQVKQNGEFIPYLPLPGRCPATS